ncbi:MAG: hypothetical protein ACE1ZL_07605, partial [Gammaproteobacteria bacterium]
MAKLKASLIHLALSSVVVGSIFLIIFFAWYPYPYFEIRARSRASSSNAASWTRRAIVPCSTP